MTEVPLLMPMEAAPRDGTRFLALCETWYTENMNGDRTIIGYTIRELSWNDQYHSFSVWSGDDVVNTLIPLQHIVGWEHKSLAMRYASGELAHPDDVELPLT